MQETYAFAPIARPSSYNALTQQTESINPTIQRQRRFTDEKKSLSPVSKIQRSCGSRSSVATVSMKVFGLGAPEFVIILVAAAFVLGPQKLAELGKDAGKIAGELKEVPKEFQAGLAEGEKQAKAMKEEVSPVITSKKE